MIYVIVAKGYLSDGKEDRVMCSTYFDSEKAALDYIPTFRKEVTDKEDPYALDENGLVFQVVDLRPATPEEKRFLAFDVGCIECGEDSRPIGLYASREAAQVAAKAATEAYDASPPIGQHSIEVFEIS